MLIKIQECNFHTVSYGKRTWIVERGHVSFSMDNVWLASPRTYFNKNFFHDLLSLKSLTSGSSFLSVRIRGFASCGPGFPSAGYDSSQWMLSELN